MKFVFDATHHVRHGMNISTLQTSIDPHSMYSGKILCQIEEVPRNGGPQHLTSSPAKKEHFLSSSSCEPPKTVEWLIYIMDYTTLTYTIV